MSRLKTFSALLAVAVIATSAFSANSLSTGGHNGVIRSQAADVLGIGTFNLGGAFHFGQEYKYVHSTRPDLDRDGSPRMASGVVNMGIGIAPVLDLAVNIPVYWDNPQFSGVDHPVGFGDLEVSLKLAGFALKNDDDPITGAYYLALQFPTGSDEGVFPRHAYYGREGNWTSGNVLFHPMLISTIHFDRFGKKLPLTLNLNIGGVFNAPNDNNAVTSSVSLNIKANEVLSFFVEASAEERFKTVRAKHFFGDLINDPIFITPGLSLTIPNSGLTMTLAGDVGVSESDKQFAQKSSFEDKNGSSLHQANMLYNAIFALNWQIKGKQDKDGDGVMDKNDKCPDQAEDKDGFEDEDGCPDTDNDKDGIADSNDKCPTEAGVAENNGCPDVDTDKDGIVDRLDKCPKDAGIEVNNGCPDVDSDKDGIVDRLDKCANVAGIAENDGCPDIDTDKDGVVDRLDKCPGELEDKDGFKDEDGCADLDNDGDGIPDVNDKCPNNPGTIKTEGCPKSKELRGALVLKGVNFGSGKSTLLTSSYAALDQIAESLREWPEVRVEIQGHTDNTGDDAMNMELSRQRAETVRQYLVNKGIDSNRLTSNGYGEEKPVADNKTAAGRAKNRRVELNRIN